MNRFHSFRLGLFVLVMVVLSITIAFASPPGPPPPPPTWPLKGHCTGIITPNDSATKVPMYDQSFRVKVTYDGKPAWEMEKDVLVTGDSLNFPQTSTAFEKQKTMTITLEIKNKKTGAVLYSGSASGGTNWGKYDPDTYITVMAGKYKFIMHAKPVGTASTLFGFIPIGSDDYFTFDYAFNFSLL